jgi:hypothetical protein
MAALDSVAATVALYTIATHEKISKHFKRRLQKKKHTIYKLDMKFVARETKLKA